MKKLYSAILAILFGTTSLLAQEESSFAFMMGEQIIPNGSTVTISEYEDLDIMIEMQAPIYIKNISEDTNKLSLTCVGKENYSDIEVCANGSCKLFGSNEELTTTYEQNITPGGTVEKDNNWLHVHLFDTKTFKGSVELKAYCTLDPDDCATITVVFDTNAQGINAISTDSQKVEVYNLCGKKIAESTMGLKKGIYIIKQNGTSRKVVIK